MITRYLSKTIINRLFTGKAILLTGARQVGKSTLFREIIAQTPRKILFLNGDEPEVQSTLSNINTTELKILIANNEVIVVDEAQRISNIGLTLKRIADNFPQVQILATGSSAFDLKNILEEPLTGRKYEYFMYPISTGEIIDTHGLIYAKQIFEQRMIYGSYPEILTKPTEAKELLTNLSSSYLYKDILALDSVRKSAAIDKLLVTLALNVGSEISSNYIAKTVGLDIKTVDRYISLLEKCYVIFRIGALSRNLNTELRKSKKIYFYDNGIRNAILQNFAPLQLRSDTGSLLENFFIVERIKRNESLGLHPRYYFWRTENQQEIDFIEELDGRFNIFEMKWNLTKSGTKFPQKFIEAYKVEDANIVTPENYIQFVV